MEPLDFGDRSRSRGAIRQSRRLGRLTTGWSYATTMKGGRDALAMADANIIYFLKEPRAKPPTLGTTVLGIRLLIRVALHLDATTTIEFE